MVALRRPAAADRPSATLPATVGIDRTRDRSRAIAPDLPNAPLWVMTSYFNPMGYRLRRENYHVFRHHLKAPLATIEWSPDGCHELAEADADLMVRVEGGGLLWQKERLLNLLLPHLPPSCRFVAWVDCDVVFGRADWVELTIEALQRQVLVQLFDEARQVPQLESARLMAMDRWAELPSELTRRGLIHATPVGLSLAEWGRQQTTIQVRQNGLSTGFAWAAPRTFLEQHPFIDTWVAGGGDAANVFAAMGAPECVLQRHQLNPVQAAYYLPLAQRIAEAVDGRVGCLPGTVYALWHGTVADRGYRARHEVVASHGFDPDTFLTPAASGVWQWTERAAALAEDVRAYFLRRNEDGLPPASPKAPG